MKKILSFLFIFYIFISVSGQLDREHWFAPMVDRTGNPDQYQKLYLSTNRTTSFPVSIYNNNILIGTVNISKNNPQKFDVLRAYIITTQQTDLFTPTTKGLYLKAEFPFYVNLRFSVFNHAEIITSKGIPSTGKNFYVTTAPITVSNPILNFMASILATEDNTTVTVNGYRPTVQFSNGTTGTTNPTMTFTLNKGQSYIIDGLGTINTDGFIGAKITANKPVNVTNGNFNGQYSGNISTSSDILMDQSVPVERLGSEFALVKGNGSIGANMEGAVIVATEDNTLVYVNNEIPPVATLNTGQYFVIPDTKYQNQGSNHYNLYIRTSKNAYVYQILAGDSTTGNESATGGFNFIPALNCYLPKQINELGFINENYVLSNNNPLGILNIPTKLNLITERGATVTVNGGIPPATTGPFNMTGTTNWVTYGIPNVSGNITIVSDKAITAGITAGSDAVGYGGFFAGFPTQPVILKSGGDCVPGIVLTIDPIIYDSYQWYVNGGIIPGATGSSITPTQSGYYTCSVTMGSCAPLVTEQFKVQNCTKLSTASYNACTPLTITPTFSSSTQTPVVSTIAITTAPALGTATINPTTGVITYTPTPGASGTDTFTYTFCGNDPVFTDCETVTVTVHIESLTVSNVTLRACNINGQGTFNLTTANVTNNSPVTITYYPTLIDAQTENAAALITAPNTYTAPDGTIVYAVVKNSIGCKSIAQITLSLYNLAIVQDNYTGVFCDDNFDGTVNITLSAITAIVLNNPTYFTNVRYYASLADANAGNNNTLPNNWSYNAATTIYIRVDSPDGCASVIKPLKFSIGAKVPLITTAASVTLCDDDLDGIKTVSLASLIPSFTTDPSVTYTFYATLADAQNNTSPIAASVTVTTAAQTYYIRFEKNGVCPEVGSIRVVLKVPKKSDILKDKIICPKTTTTLDAGPGFESYLWSTGATSPSITNVPAGSYWVDLGFNGCIYRQNVTVSESPLPIITSIEINGSTVTVGVSGGTPPYEYSLDGVSWQSSNVFNNVPRGNHTVFVKDSNYCEEIKKEFALINLINTITPNSDGHNDQIDYSALMANDNLEFRIFDRYGAEIFRGTPSNRFTWDGRMGGRPVPTATYWYFISWTEYGSAISVKYSSWLLVKHK